MINEKHSFLGKKMLIIGDDTAFLNSIELMFLYAGIDILIFNDINKGVMAIKTQKPDLILLQTKITNESINNLLSEVEAENNCGIPIIVVADIADGIINNKSITKIIGKKNIDIIDLIRSIETHLQQSTNSNSEKKLDITEQTLTPTMDFSKTIRVLVVEDDPLLRNLLSVKLTKSKIPYLFCHNGNEVLPIALQYKPTLIILDLMLPGKNGIDVLNDMRKKTEFIQTPVIIFSNKDNDEDRKKAKLLGVNDFLIKAMTDLNQLVSLIINKHSS